MTQPTDEAAVEQAREILASLTSIEGAKGLILSGAWDRTETMRACLAGIALGRAQLTAATRRAEQAEKDAADRKAEADQWQAKGFEHEAKLEQAERMLAEVPEKMFRAYQEGFTDGPGDTSDDLHECWAISDALKACDAIRSAASGEQG